MAELIKALILRFRRFLSFGIIGCINTGVDLAVFTLCSTVFESSPSSSQIAGYIAGVACSFLLNRSITFKDRTENFLNQIILFVIVNAASLLISTSLITYLTNMGLNAYVAKILVTGAVMVINYFGYKLLVFKVKPSPSE